MRRTSIDVAAPAQGVFHCAFTLVELLCAMALIFVLLTVTIVLLVDSQRAVERNNRDSAAERAGRRAIALIQHDLENTIAQGMDGSALSNFGVGNHQIVFPAFTRNDADGRAFQAVWYWLVATNDANATNDAYVLYRAVETLSPTGRIDAFPTNSGAWFAAGPPSNGIEDIIADNVTALRFVAVTDLGIPYDPGSPQSVPTDVLPACLDIYLETIVRGATDRITHPIKHFTARVQFANREGYRVR